MKPHALPTSIAGIALFVLILGAWANSSFADSHVADHFSDRHAVSDCANFLTALRGSNDEEQIELAPDSVLSELPRDGYLDDEAGKPLVIASATRRRDLGVYLSYLRERGPPFCTTLV